MGGFTIDTSGRSTAHDSARVHVNEGGSASQSFNYGGQNVGTIQYGGNNYSVHFDPDQGNYNYQSGPYVNNYRPVGTVGGQQYYDQSSYASALKSEMAGRQGSNDSKSKAVRDARVGNAPTPTTMPTDSGLRPIDASQVGKRQPEEAKPEPKKSSVVPTVSTEAVESTDKRPKKQKKSNVADAQTVIPGLEEALSQELPKASGKDPGKPGRPKKTKVEKSKMARAMKELDRQAANGSKTIAIRPSDIDASIKVSRLTGALQRSHDNAADARVLKEYLENWQDPTEAEIANASAIKNYYRDRQNARDYLAALNESRIRDYEANRREAKYKVSKEKIDNTLNELAGYDDSGYDMMVNLGDARKFGEDLDSDEAQEKLRKKLLKTQESRLSHVSDSVLEHKRDKKNRGLEDKTPGQRPWADEKSVLKKLADARDEIRLRLLNPMRLRIESEHIETKVEGKGKRATVKAKMRWDVDVEDAIHNVKDKFGNCSTRDVMALVQLRAGLGVSLKGLIGGQKASDFVLSKEQFIEICKDIITSQDMYGHPMALVKDAPGGIRDNSGMFIVIANTRCFPIGYVPTYLLANLSVDPNSALYGKSIGQIERAIGNSWINETYPNLCKNAEGNLLWQARAIENMMRAVMSIDGISPTKLDIPEIKVNKTMMQMAAEKEQARDPAIMRSNEERERREKRANETTRARYLKNSSGHDKDGNIVSPSRRRNMIGDSLRGVSSIEKGCKAADFFLLVTSPIEALQSIGEQHIGDNILSYMFDKMHPGVKERYQLSDRLKQASTRRQSVEARSVLEALFRIGGWNAIDAFVSATNDNDHLGIDEGVDGAYVDGDGGYKYKLTNADLRRFLADYGMTGGSVPDALMKEIGIDPKQAPAFMMNVNAALDFLEDTMLGNNLFKQHEAGQFVKLAMNEMARSSVRGDEAYTTEEVEQWAEINGEEMMRSLIRTNAGREAFMTQGITSLGRKSPMDYAVRQIMAKNGLTELAIRTFFDRFPEYGLNKVMRQVPASNTLSYLGSWGIDSVASLVGIVNEGNKVGRYQAGGTYYGTGGLNRGFVEGLVKNLMYDTVMAANRLIISGVYWGILEALGGVHRPPDPEQEYNWSEWIIGNDEDSMPIKWAWFMDDISGVGFPLGVAWAIAASESNSTNPAEWTTEAKDIAAKTFMNAISNFNDGTVVFDCLDLFDDIMYEERDAVSDDGIGMWLKPSDTERRQTLYELQAWKFIGDMTPSVVKQILPWSRDFLFRGGDPYARSASKVYSNRNQENGSSKYSMEEAIADYRVRDVANYHEYMIRREAQNNPIAALLMDLAYGAGFWSNEDNKKTGYMFTEQPYRTETDKLAKLQWDKYSLDKSRLPKDPNEAREACRAWAEWICQDIDANYSSPADALEKGFCMNPTARKACQEYCLWMFSDNGNIDQQLDQELDRLREDMCTEFLPDDIYNSKVEAYNNMKDHYRMLYNNYFSGDSDIPWRLPRYKVFDSDAETTYVDNNGNAAVNPYIASLVNNIAYAVNSDYRVTPGTAKVYPYGNRPNALPFYSPERTLGFDNQTEPYWLRRDEDGNVTNDLAGLYSYLSGDVSVGPGTSDKEKERLQKEAQEALAQMYGGRGEDAIPTAGKRGLENLDVSMPAGFNPYYDPEEVSKELGFDAFDKKKAKEDKEKKKLEDRIKDLENGYGGGRGYGSRRYYGGGYGGGGRRYYGGGGGGYSSSYNPKIYSNAKNVYSSHAAGMRTSQPYKASTTYLRPSHYKSGSREASRRQY